MKAKHYAVLTGDLVHSSKLTSELSVKAMQWLREAGNQFSEQYPGSIVGGVDTFRHDSWQLLMVDPSLCIRAAVFFRARIMFEADTGFNAEVVPDLIGRVMVPLLDCVACCDFKASSGVCFDR